MLTVENSARSAILCLTLYKIADEYSQMHTKRSVLWRSYRATSTLSLASLGYHCIPLTRISSVRHSDSSLCPLGTQRLPYIHLGHLTHERSRQRCSSETVAYAAVDSGRRSGERERGTPTFILGLRRTSRCRSHRGPSWSSTGMNYLTQKRWAEERFVAPSRTRYAC